MHLHLLPALALLPLIQGPDRPASVTDDDKPYPEMVLAHVLSGKPDRLDPKRPVVHIRIDGSVMMGDAIYLDSTWTGEDAKRGWANLHKEFVRLVEDLPFKPADPEQPEGFKVRAGSVLVRADLNSPFAMTLGVLENLFTRDVRIPQVDFAVGNARKPVFDPAIGLVPQTGPQQVLAYSVPFDVHEEEEGTTPAPKPPVFRVRIKKPGDRLSVERASKIPWAGDGRFRWDMSTRHVEYAVGESKVLGYMEFRRILQGMQTNLRGQRVILDLGPQVTTAEALTLYDALLGLGVKDALFRRGGS